MIKELGYCPGIENYSRYFDGRAAGTRPFCLIDYFPKDYLMVVDESHVTLPQVPRHVRRRPRPQGEPRGVRVPPPGGQGQPPVDLLGVRTVAGHVDLRERHTADYELMKSEGVIVEQLIRPTGLVDPPLEVRVTLNQIDDLIGEIDKRVKNDDKVLVTTITKRMAEELSKYFDRVGVRNRYIHSDVDTLERIQILEDLRAGMFDVLVGVNLLREGLDLPRWRSWRSSTPTRRDPAQRPVAHADRRTRRAPLAGQRDPLRRHLHRLDALRHRAGATAAARSRCATTWSTKCCRGRRRRAARDRARCWRAASTRRRST